jgi:hypothetical protein
MSSFDNSIYIISPLDAIKEIFDMTVINHNKFVAPYEETRWVTMSSLFFLVPSIYGYKNEQYFMSIVLCLSSVFSVNFWRHATYSYRRIADRIYAKIAFMICCINGIRYSYLDPLIIIGWISFLIFVYCYYMSNKYCNDLCYNKNYSPNSIWWKYHVLFHFFAMQVQIITINRMIEYANRNTN